ncbi:hypothetical protein DERP_014593, partial [Dermatophagoides pteronyssinus]
RTRVERCVGAPAPPLGDILLLFIWPFRSPPGPGIIPAGCKGIDAYSDGFDMTRTECKILTLDKMNNRKTKKYLSDIHTLQKRSSNFSTNSSPRVNCLAQTAQRKHST